MKLILLLLLLFPSLSMAQEYSNAQLVADVASVAPSKPFYAAVRITLEEGWHTYTKDPGDAGLPPRINWNLPAQFTPGDIQWPKAETFDEAGIKTYGYSGGVTLPVEITPPADVAQGTEYPLAATVEYLICKDICIPQTANVSLTLPGGNGEPSADAEDIRAVLNAINSTEQLSSATTQTAAQQPDIGFAAALLLALAGGVVLNLMPCVFPVLSLKALKIARYTGKERSHIRAEGVAYTVGVLLCFAAIAGLLLILKSSGEAIGWGYQMQSAAFVNILALLLFVIGLNLSGLYELPVLLGNVDIDVKHTHPLKKSFATGVLATLVATPCTAPFMASAIGYGLTLPPLQALLIFEALGLGLALPFLLLTFFPALLAYLPKPGAWMERFRQLLAYPMYASAIWLLWVLGMQVGAEGIILALLAMLGVSFTVWMRALFRRESKAYKLLALVLITGVVAGSSLALHRMDNRQEQGMEMESVPYSKAALTQLRSEGKAVFVDATAAWCITCQLNYHSTLTNARVLEAFKQNNITFMVADWTKKNPEITALLAEFGHSGVPMYVYFPAQGEPVVLPQILTPDSVIDVIDVK